MILAVLGRNVYTRKKKMLVSHLAFSKHGETHTTDRIMCEPAIAVKRQTTRAYLEGLAILHTD